MPLDELDLDKDDKFRELELARRETKQRQSKIAAEKDHSNIGGTKGAAEEEAAADQTATAAIA